MGMAPFLCTSRGAHLLPLICACYTCYFLCVSLLWIQATRGCHPCQLSLEKWQLEMLPSATFPWITSSSEFLLPKRSNSLGWFLTGPCLWPLLQQRPCGSSQSRGKWGGVQGAEFPRWLQSHAGLLIPSARGGSVECAVCVIACLPPACGCLSEAINSSRLYFPNLFREPKFISHGMNLFILEFFSRKLLWREGNPHAYLAGREFEVQEVNSLLQDHRRLV